jgi:hypothetical protein
MIVKSYVISNGNADYEVWTTSFRIYPDGLVINTGFKENFIIDYIDVPALKKGLSEISNDNPEIIVECSIDDDCIIRMNKDEIDILVDDDSDEIVASFYYEEIKEVIEVLTMVEEL